MSNKVKISYQDDIRLKSIENINSLDALIEDAASTFDLEKGSFIVKYKDNIIADNQHFLQLKSNNQGTLRLFVVPMPKVEQIQLPKIEQPQIEQPKVEQPKIEQPIPKVEQPKEQPKPIPNYPSKPNIFQALFSNPPQNNSNSGSNSLFSGLLSLIPGMGGLGGLGNMGGDLSSIMTKNLSSIMKIFTENLPKDKMEELLVAVIKTIPREQLVSLLQNALASPKVQELLITSLLNTFDNLEKKQEKSQENTNQAPQPTQTQVQEEIQKKQKEWEEKTKQEEELNKQENLRMQEEEAQRIREEEKRKELENQKRNAELKRQEEEKIRLLEELRKQQDEENRRKQEEFRRQEELRKQQEEENRKKQEEEEFKKQEEIKKQQEEELRRQQEEELKKQEEIKKQEELLRQQEEKENQRIRFLQPYFQRLQNSNVPYESFRAAEEMGFINLEDVNGIEKVVTLLIKYKGNVELVANELFN